MGRIVSDLEKRSDIRGELVPPTTKESGFLRLPIDQDQFKDFIKGLLGRPQSISRTMQGPYEIEMSDVQNLDQLIWQRIQQQNGGILAQFNARLVYWDDSTVEINSVPELLSYNEVRPIVCVGLHLRWDYLLQFADKRTPEKQGIVVSYSSAESEEIRFDSDPESIDRVAVRHSRGVIQFRIEHTARTWGADMEALLHNFFKGQIRLEHPVKNWIRRYQIPISFTVAIVFLSSLLLAFS